MPKITFLNLPEEKRGRIIDIAIDEFAEYGYQQASISRIVERSEIAKGSFYQYFEDKKDLFKHILFIGGEKKLIYIHHIMEELNELDFFHILRELYVGGVQYAKDHPKLSEIANNFIKNSDEALKKEIIGESAPRSIDFFKGLLMRGIQRQEIDPNIDIELVAYLITSMSVSISEYFLKEKKVKDDMEIMELVDKMLGVFEHGIKVKKEA